MVQKLPRTLYDHVVHQHRTFASKHKLDLPFNKSEMYQQIAASPELPAYMDKCKWEGGKRMRGRLDLTLCLFS